MVDELVPDDDVDGGLLPEVAGLLLGEDVHGGGVLVFIFILYLIVSSMLFLQPSCHSPTSTQYQVGMTT